jgi:hypothetical protein
VTYALHFGVISEDFFAPIAVAGHDDPETEHSFTLALPGQGERAALVSGSWAQWDHGRQAVDGDDSLHVVVTLGVAERPTFDLSVAVRAALLPRIAGEASVLSMAVVTDAADWSKDIKYIALPALRKVM